MIRETKIGSVMGNVVLLNARKREKKRKKKT